MYYEFLVGIVDETSSTIGWDITKFMESYGDITLKKGDYWYIKMRLGYGDSARSDVPFTVKWDDLTIDFSTAK